MAKKNIKSLERVRNRAGYTFVAHWALGLLLFFIFPLVSSIWYAFNDVTIEVGNIKTEFLGIDYFVELITEDPNYVTDLRDSIGMMCYSLPIIISLLLHLNNKDSFWCERISSIRTSCFSTQCFFNSMIIKIIFIFITK